MTTIDRVVEAVESKATLTYNGRAFWRASVDDFQKALPDLTKGEIVYALFEARRTGRLTRRTLSREDYELKTCCYFVGGESF